MKNLIQKAAQDIIESKNVAVLTGAGISVESGIPPFRGKGGVWEKIDPMEYAHIDAFRKNPAKVWTFIKQMKDIIDASTPNDAHKSIAYLEEIGKLKTVITQNVDSLHQSAGSHDVIEFHGSFAWYRCTKCNQLLQSTKIDVSDLPPYCVCGGIYRPDCIFFGETIPEDILWRSKKVSQTCDLMLVIGTSATVQPAAMIPIIAKNNGAKIIEINIEPSHLTDHISDYMIQGMAGAIMNEIIVKIGMMVS